MKMNFGFQIRETLSARHWAGSMSWLTVPALLILALNAIVLSPALAADRDHPRPGEPELGVTRGVPKAVVPRLVATEELEDLR